MSPVIIYFENIKKIGGKHLYTVTKKSPNKENITFLKYPRFPPPENDFISVDNYIARLFDVTEDIE